MIYRRDGVDRLLNFQSEGGEVKAYQLRQLLDAVDDFGLELE